MNVRKSAAAPFQAAGRGLKALTSIRFPGGSFRLFPLLTRTRFDYEREVDPMQNSAVAACLNWIMRTFPEAPITLFQEGDDGEREMVVGHPLTMLLMNPNPHHSWATLIMATLVDWLTGGNAYWLKVRSAAGRVVELWWVPVFTMKPKWPTGGDTFISHYEYRPGGGAPVRIEVEDVVHLQWGIDPNNVRLGWSPIKSVLREIFTDDEAANFTASLLRNMGVPGAIISPAEKEVTIDPDEGELVKEQWRQSFGGDRRGDVMVASAKTEVKVLSWSPQQMDLGKLRQIPEERVTAVLGIPAAVVGLGTGLEQTKVGATMRELREQAYESGIIPLQRLLALIITRQLLVDFDDTGRFEVGFDLRNVRVLQEDENALHARLREDLIKGGITRAEFRKATGHEADANDDVWLLPLSTIEVSRSTGELVRPEEGDSMTQPLEAASGAGNGTSS